MLLRFAKLPTSEGRGPVSELYDKSKKLREKRGSLNISAEMDPLRWFLDKSRIYILFPMGAGIGPSRLALGASRISSFERFPIDEGI
jgi:hypothetical protein